jgi:hypothetical protein
MKIMRNGKKFIVVTDGFNVIFEGDNYEQARAYLANMGNDDARGSLSRGNVDIFGEYDEETQKELRAERKKSVKVSSGDE